MVKKLLGLMPWRVYLTEPCFELAMKPMPCAMGKLLNGVSKATPQSQRKIFQKPLMF